MEDYTKHPKNNSIPTGDLANDPISRLGTNRSLVGRMISKQASKSSAEPFKGTEFEKPADAIDKVTGWLDKKMAGWAGKSELKKEGGDKK